MDKNKLIAVLAYKLESSGVKREIAVSEAKSFVGSLSEEESAKLISLIGNDAVMTHIAASLKKRTETSTSLSPVKNAAAKETAQNKSQQTQPQHMQPQQMQQQKQIQPQQPAPQKAQPSQPAPQPQARVNQPQQQNQPKPRQEQTSKMTVLPAPARQVQQPLIRPVADPDRQIVSEQRRQGNAPERGAVRNDVRGEVRRDTPSVRDAHPQKARQPENSEALRREVRPEQKRVQSPVQMAAANQNSASNKNKTRKEDANDEKRIIYRPDPNADYRKFYIILACTSPIWLFLALVGITAFLFVLGGMCISIVLLILALVGGVAVGTILSLVGIIYGITQLFKYAPIGLYEIGLGLMIGGITMLAGIIVYNVAVRLLPFLIKKVSALLVYTMHKCVELYFYAKGACADL